MKPILFTIVFFLLVNLGLQQTFAATSVNIQDNRNGATSDVHVDNSVGQSTICVNGHCTATGNGKNQATVCINGDCTTSPDGNIDKQEGGASVHIQNHNNGSNTNSPAVTTPSESETITPLPTDMPSTSPEASPSAKQKQAPNQQLQSQPTGIEGLMNDIKQFFSSFMQHGK